MTEQKKVKKIRKQVPKFEIKGIPKHSYCRHGHFDEVVSRFDAFVKISGVEILVEDCCSGHPDYLFEYCVDCNDYVHKKY